MSVTGSSIFVKVATVRVVMVMVVMVMVINIMVTVIAVAIVIVNTEGTSSFSAAYDLALVVTLFRLSVVSARHLWGYR
jgi:hypothetical protein